jgi:6-phosphogluconolactonase
MAHLYRQFGTLARRRTIGNTGDPMMYHATTVVYASVGPILTRYAVDSAAGTLAGGDSLTLPANVQYAWPHAAGRYLYVACSNGAPGLGAAGDAHWLSALAIDPISGALSPHGDPIALPARPIHLTLDPVSRYALVAFNNPAAIRVYRIGADGKLDGHVEQRSPIEAGIFPHQVRVTADGRRAILVSRGHDATPEQPEQPGALNVFAYADGQLSQQQIVAPHGGFGFGPRHLDFHPTQPWVYVSIERQNGLAMFAWATDGTLETAPRFSVSTLTAPPPGPHHQLVGTVHVHPDGRTVYVANRSPSIFGGGHQPVFAGGDNTIVVCRIDPASGEPSIIQRIDTGGIHCRTFHIDPTGTLLVAAHIAGVTVEQGTNRRHVPAGLSVFRIAADGTLTLLRRYEEKTERHLLFWMGMAVLPTA